MKRRWIGSVLAALLLTGCGTQETFETVLDVADLNVSAAARQVLLSLPEEAAVCVFENAETGSLYLCDGYSISLQTLQGGDLDRTLRTVTGYGREQLTVMQTRQSDVKRYECVWSAAGEGEDQVCRAVILDDGGYHYVLTAMAGQSAAGALAQTWQEIFSGFGLTDTGL